MTNSIQSTPPEPPAIVGPLTDIRSTSSALPFSLSFLALHSFLWCAFLALLVFYVPRFEKNFRDFNMVLPTVTVVYLEVSRWCANYWYVLPPWVLLCGAVDGVILTWLYRRREMLALGWAFGLTALPLLLVILGAFALLGPLLKLLDSLSR